MLLQGCSSSPNPVLYTIAPVPGVQRGNAPPVILLQQIGLERYLERSQIVRSSENYRLDLMTNDWWGEPLAAMLSRNLVEEIEQRLPGTVVINETGAISAAPGATISLNVQRLDEDASGRLILQAQVGVSFHAKAPPTLRIFRFSVVPPTGDAGGEVAAISAALGQLSDGIAEMVAAGPNGR
jgi:hypothetical protein